MRMWRRVVWYSKLGACFLLVAYHILDSVDRCAPSETSANFYKTTRRYIPEDSTLHIIAEFLDFSHRIILRQRFGYWICFRPLAKRCVLFSSRNVVSCSDERTMSKIQEPSHPKVNLVNCTFVQFCTKITWSSIAQSVQWLEYRGNRVRFPTESRSCSLVHTVQTGCGTHPA
jgi:hypothetical protein